ncbi:hypothetical protein [Paraburkholderia sp. Ac-20347]|uniref:hypothetical protein n=1 Tax=Paraburkholderia sp. Ac-20347 TaxID=2703892 RepID=UPI001982403B|nr:hypothetical protein [Paraburkholderia sp. Ac-20347]MBN3808739.1 hypothetical protein [Paraburkholderia sp. Ac-20347]
MEPNRADSTSNRKVQALTAAVPSDAREANDTARRRDGKSQEGNGRHREKKDRLASWKVLAPLVGAATLYFSYLVGVTFHQTYLERFGINPGAFPQGRSDYLVFAVLAAMKDLDIVFGAVMKSRALLAAAGTLAIVGAVSFALVEGATALGKRLRGRPAMSARKKLLAMYVLALPFGGVYLMFAVPAAFATVMVLPVELGAAAAVAITADDLADYQKGCAVHSHGKRCFNLVEGNETIASGFIIQQSKDTVALWDSGVVKVLPLDKRGLISVDSMKKPW